jgi:hypothetical protein
MVPQFPCIGASGAPGPRVIKRGGRRTREGFTLACHRNSYAVILPFQPARQDSPSHFPNTGYSRIFSAISLSRRFTR